MKNIFAKIFVIGLILFVKQSNLLAQESTTLQFMKGMPQSDLMNPALHNDSSKVVIGLPGMSGMYFDFNSGFPISDLIHKGTGMLADSLVIDIEKFHHSLSTTNPVQQHFSLPLFYLAIRIKKSFFSIGITEKEVAQFTFAKNLVTFIKDGNAPYMGQNFDLGDINMDAFHYREFALGYSNELIKNKLTIGGKAKVLYGKFALQTERMNLKVETAADGSYLNLNSDMKINFSAPVAVEFDEENYFTGINGDDVDPKDYMLQTGNTGLAFDLGAVYKLTPRITFSGSIIDMGKISFKENLNNLTHVSTYKWEGIDFSKSIGESQEDYVDPADLVDDEMKKIENSFKPKRSEFASEAFDVNIPVKIYLGGTYGVSKNMNIGILDRIYKNGNVSQNTLTLSANTLIGNFLSLSGSYSMIDNSTKNLGLGIAIRMGFMQLYLVGDNVLAIADPSKVDYANLRFGLNYLFGRHYKERMAEPSEIQ